MVSASSYIPPFYFYQFAQAISAPYSALNAYKSEIIDENGNILKPESSVDPFEYLVIKLKKIFDMLPGNLTKAQLKNYFTALQYFTEEAKQYNLAQDELSLFIEGYVSAITDGKTSYLELVEDMSAGGMAAPAEKPESTGGVVGYDPVMAMGLQRRKQPKYFDNCEIFDVCPEEFIQFKAAKTWQDIPEGENKTYLQRFQRRNFGKKIAIKSLNPLNGESELHWITYPSKNFMEEFDLRGLGILHEDTSDLVTDILGNTKNVDASKLNILFENVKTSKQGYNAGHVIERLTSMIGTQEDYDISKLTKDQVEYTGRMIDWVNGFHAASTSGEEGHGEQWIDLGFKNAIKKASQNDSKGPDVDPDGFRYDPTSKSKQFQDRVIRVDYGTDRKPVGQLSRKRKGIVLQGQTIDLPPEGSKFKDTVRELIQSPEFERRIRGEMEKDTQIPQIIAHKTFTDTKKLLSQRGFVVHPIEQLKQILQSRLFKINPEAGKPTKNEPHGRQTVNSTDLRVRGASSPSTESDIGYDEIRSMPGGDAPKEATTVSLEALDHLFDQIPDGYKGPNGINKDTLRQHVSKILAPHIKRGRYPLELPSSKTISV